MIVQGAWWDIVDAIAPSRLGALLCEQPAAMQARMKRWARGDDLWKRRAAILCQLKLKQETDPELLRACIEPSLGHSFFFLRKGIGWALREYAKTDPRWVVEFVAANQHRLSALSRREALRRLAQHEERRSQTAADRLPPGGL
jgi:3-methyladenine DNA glycosylase AlkD